MTERYIAIETNLELIDLEAALWKRYYAQQVIMRGLPYGCPLDHCPGDIRVFLALAPEFAGNQYQLTGERQPRAWVTVRAPIPVVLPADGGEGALLIVDTPLASWLDSVDNVGVDLPARRDLQGLGMIERGIRTLGLRAGVPDNARTLRPQVTATRKDRTALLSRWEDALAARGAPAQAAAAR